MNRMTRVQIDLPEEKVAQLELLMAEAGLTTKKEFINNALTLLAWAIREVKTGRVIASVDNNTNQYKEILLPALENAALGKQASANQPLAEFQTTANV